MPLVVSHCTAKTWVRWIGAQHSIDFFDVGGCIFGRRVHRMAPAGDLTDPPRALSIGTIDQQHLAAARQELVSMASTANVPEPCIGTATCPGH